MKAKILITLGDPSGIGPEIILKAVPQMTEEGLIPIVIGSHLVLEKAKENLGMDLVIHKTTPPFETDHRDDKGLLLYDISSLKEVRFGRPQREGALEALKYVKESVRLLQEGIGEAMVTCPVNKEVIASSGIEFKGHTELIAELCGVRDYVMMLCGPRLRVSLVTRHIALRDVPRSLTQEAVLLTSRITYEALLRDFGIRGPRLALAGLNPHAGEGNLFGDEEEKILRPALRHLKEEGIPIEGPFSPDTIF
ncbi:MAG: PdxA family protein, partial [Desulfatiglandales bacterium]